MPLRAGIAASRIPFRGRPGNARARISSRLPACPSLAASAREIDFFWSLSSLGMGATRRRAGRGFAVVQTRPAESKRMRDPSRSPRILRPPSARDRIAQNFPAFRASAARERLPAPCSPPSSVYARARPSSIPPLRPCSTPKQLKYSVCAPAHCRRAPSHVLR